MYMYMYMYIYISSHDILPVLIDFYVYPVVVLTYMESESSTYMDQPFFHGMII